MYVPYTRITDPVSRKNCDTFGIQGLKSVDRLFMVVVMAMEIISSPKTTATRPAHRQFSATRYLLIVEQRLANLQATLSIIILLIILIIIIIIIIRIFTPFCGQFRVSRLRFKEATYWLYKIINAEDRTNCSAQQYKINAQQTCYCIRYLNAKMLAFWFM